MSQASYPEFAWRWAMKKQEVILKAIAGEIKWIQAADILGVSPRTIRRLNESYQRYGINGLIDQRTGGRLIAELRRAGIDNIAAANQYINEVFLPDMNRRFSVPAEGDSSAFFSSANFDLYFIFSVIHKNRSVYADNTVRVDGLSLQIEKSPYRISFAKCKVDIYNHMDNTYSVIWKKRIIGHYNEKGEAINYNGGPAPNPPRGLSHYGIPDGQKKKGQSKMPCPSVYSPAAALGSLPSVALSSEQAE